ncbi:DUF2059 domain-containing protein [Sphingobium sp. Sx8-8]|uniref:DUF2059 domain-containing protein n=1 Tax=Sphingobium sp. Sx8-8 TaxID=2933617 RepID=UPI001F59F16D|nr:DUF2059 domain-containing protein [Sphingobium sp. Sx8-8]
MKRAMLMAVPLLALAAPAPAQPAPMTAATEQSAPVDPVLLAKARPVAAIILPDGTMARMMGPMMQKVMGPMMEGFTRMPVRDLLKAGGMNPAEADTLKPATIQQIMEIVDPSYQKRMNILVNGMGPALGRFMSRFEPDMREGMAEAFASRYDAAELDQISAFMKTPAGAKFGSGFMELAADPHYIGKMQAMMPALMQAMPEIMKDSQAQMAALPKPRAYKDLTPAERKRLEALLGADPKKVTK